MNYKVIGMDDYCRKGTFRHFSEECKCSTSMTARVDVTEPVSFSKRAGTKFYVNFLYIPSKVLNPWEDDRTGYFRQTKEVVCYNKKLLIGWETI